MRAMILAAGRGARMRPLTDHVPKPMLKVVNKPLLQYHVEALVAAGFTDLVINHARFGEQVESYFGDGNRFGVSIHYSPEGDNPLETGGGIKKALPLLGHAPFLVVNGDVWTDYDFSKLQLADDKLAHLLLVNNPQHHPEGDFALINGCIENHGKQMLTYSGVGVFSPDLFENIPDLAFPLGPVLRERCIKPCISGEHYSGTWLDIGTPERLAQLASMLA